MAAFHCWGTTPVDNGLIEQCSEWSSKCWHTESEEPSRYSIETGGCWFEVIQFVEHCCIAASDNRQLES